MPELPEVETVRRRIEPLVLGKRITQVEISWPRIVDFPNLHEFKKLLIGKTFSSINRRGKYIILALNPELYLLVHLRMSGDLLVIPTASATTKSTDTKHVHARLHLSDGSQLWFKDTRKFGRLYLRSHPDQVVGKLGPEPLSSDFSLSWLQQSLAKKKTPIKSLLLKQEFLAGLGNIYAVESLWHARVHPQKIASRFSHQNTKLLHESIQAVLNQAVESSGTDIGDGVWKHGQYQTEAYGREGKPCSRCSTPIKRIVLAQRGTEFCPNCQRR